MTNEYKPTQLMIDWEKALRNPELKQTQGALCKVDEDGNKSFCCLGVLEEVAGNVAKAQPQREYLGESANNWEFHGPTAYGEVGMPSGDLIDLLFNRVTPVEEWNTQANVPLGVDYFGDSLGAADLNDDHHWTFEQIADEIRKVYIDGDGDWSKNRISAYGEGDY
jgi:hypothetical protein